MAPAPAPGPAVVWFRRDLRLADNPAWAHATAHHGRVLALFVLDHTLHSPSGPARRAQVAAELEALHETLAELGAGLVVRHGDPVALVPALAREVGAPEVVWNHDVSPYARRRDDAVAEALGAAGVVVARFWGTLVHEPGRVRTKAGGLSRVFTPFHRTWAETDWSPWPEPGDAEVVTAPTDPRPSPGDTAAPLNAPGEAAALERLHHWLDHVDRYPDTRDRADDPHSTSALSIDLKWGTLSPRTVATTVGLASPGRAAFVRQLAWRDWYAHQLHGRPDLVHHAAAPAFDHVRWRHDPAGFEAWRTGRTGYPVVDAAMRCLLATGRMHNRLRMVVASFLVKDLLIDWRLGERWFRHQLADADVSQNVGNWQWAAGTGFDAAPYFRVFNPQTQGEKADPDGTYVRTWVPELADISGRAIHAPWTLGPLELAAAGVILGADYPERIVDHAMARDRAIAAYKAAEGTAASKAAEGTAASKAAEGTAASKAAEGTAATRAAGRRA